MIQCPCCGYLTIDDSDKIITDICEVCFWQYDIVAQNNPNSIIGANRVSLNTAKKNFNLFGASEKQFIHIVRSPFENEK